MSGAGGKRSRRGAGRETNRGWRRTTVFNRVTRKEAERRICRKREKRTVNRRRRRREGHSGGWHG